MTLASAGRGSAKLWDIASGQFLLDITAGNYVPALAFSPDGKRLAVGSIAAFDRGDSVNVWDLEPGRGIGHLRGLSREPYTSIFSPDGRLIAALSSDWRVGIWDRAAHGLLHVLEVTPGSFNDNAALAFSPDGRRFAFSAGHEASLWDVTTGEPIKRWSLHEGLVDKLAFPAPDRLLLFRTETENGEFGPFSNFHPRKYPRVCRVRNLLGPEPLRPLAEIRDCNIHVFGSECSPDGKYYVIEGLGGPAGKVTRIDNLYEGPTGKKLGALPTQTPVNFQEAQFGFDSTGTVLYYAYDLKKEDGSYLLEVPSRAVLRQLSHRPRSLAPRAGRWLMDSAPGVDQPASLILFEQDRREPLVKFVLEFGLGVWVGKPQFSPDGLHLIWGNPGGSVTLIDLVEVNHRLSELGLGW
jgi:WD40 repeat protein